MVIDNASLFGPALAELVLSLRRLPTPPVIVFASRYIPFERRIRDELTDAQFEEIEVPYLSDEDIDQLIETLERHNQLGHLAPLSQDERRYEFKHRARKQLLVALREATEGRDFDEILLSEYQELGAREPRVLFLCGALATAALVDLTAKQWLDCSQVSVSDTLGLLRRDLKGMLFESDGRVVARHPVIADFMLRHIAAKDEVVEAYRRVLLAVSRDIYPGVGRKHRSWRLFVRLINHDAIYEHFAECLDRAREVYELTADAFASDGHFWLQYANLEVDFGDPPAARPLLANAEGLMGETDLVLNTKAHMMLREALHVSSREQALMLRREAEQILVKQMDRAASDDEYPFHVYLTHMLGWVREWVPDPTQRKEDLERLLKLADDACLRMPRNRKIRGARDAIFRDYLSLGVSRV